MRAAAAPALSDNRCFQGSGCAIDVQLTLQPQGALVVPSALCAALALTPGGAACVILHRQQQRDIDVAALCSVCPSFTSQVSSYEVRIYVTVEPVF